MDPTFRATDLIVESSPLDPSFSGSVQELFDAFVERLRIVSPFRLLRVVVSDTQPTSNQGLWLKEGTKPYVWDETSSTYVPLDISDNLGYNFGKLVEIVLSNFDPVTFKVLAGRISGSAMLADKIITATKFVDAFGTANSLMTTDKKGKLTFFPLAPGQSVRAKLDGLLEGFTIDKSAAAMTPGTEGDTLRTRYVGGVLTTVWEKSRYSTSNTALVPLPAYMGSVEIAHGLTHGGVAVVPSFFDAFLVCHIPELGYQTGERTRVIASLDTNNDGRHQWGVFATATHINITRMRQGNGSSIMIPNRLPEYTGWGAFLTPMNWKLAAVASI